MSDFFAMGGYAWYVWGSYGVTLLVLIMEIVALRRRVREAKT
jgi:heme exporter protein D